MYVFLIWFFSCFFSDFFQLLLSNLSYDFLRCMLPTLNRIHITFYIVPAWLQWWIFAILTMKMCLYFSLLSLAWSWTHFQSISICTGWVLPFWYLISIKNRQNNNNNNVMEGGKSFIHDHHSMVIIICCVHTVVRECTYCGTRNEK